MRTISTRLRLTLWYAGLLTVILVAFGAAVYLVTRQTLYSNLDESIESQAAAILGSIRFDEGRPLLSDGTSTHSDDDLFIRVFGVSEQPSTEPDPELRTMTFPIVRDGRTVGQLEVGQSLEDVSEALWTLLIVMALAYPVTIGVAALGGAFLAGRALSPVGKITGLARRISAEDLGQRLNLELPNDEIGRLARTFDEMIERLDEAFRRQLQFTADASHELRTPLTAVKGQVEVALQRERSPADYREVLEKVNAEVDRLIGLTNSLLTLARADAGGIPLVLEDVDVQTLMSGTVEQMRPAAANKNIVVDLEPGPTATIRVDEDLVLQLLLNPLDNAIKYTPVGRVTAGWRMNGDQVELRVQDTGIGISHDHLPYLFDRFYRVDKGRSRAEGGAGLGLAISRWIAQAHGGSIRAESVPGKGSTFTVLLPTIAFPQS